MDTRDPRSVEKQTITGYATEQEIKDILEYSAIRKPCQNLTLEGVGQAHPEFRTLYANFFAEADGDLVKAIKKELTIAETNERTSALCQKRTLEDLS